MEKITNNKVVEDVASTGGPHLNVKKDSRPESLSRQGGRERENRDSALHTSSTASLHQPLKTIIDDPPVTCCLVSTHSLPLHTFNLASHIYYSPIFFFPQE